MPNVPRQLGLFPYGPARYALDFALPLPGNHAHRVRLDAWVEPGELGILLSCRCHDCVELELDLFEHGCATHAPGRACGHCDDALRELGRDLQEAFRDAPTWCTDEVVRREVIEELVPTIAPFLDRARELVDRELAAAMHPAPPPLRRALYELLERRALTPGSMAELLQARPALFALLVETQDQGLLEAAARGTPIRELEHAAERRHGVPRWLLRALPADVEPSVLRTLAPRTFPKSDLPVERAERTFWARTIARVVGEVERHDGDAAPALLDAVAAQASRHYDSMASLLDLELERYAEHVTRTGRRPPRRFAAEELMAWAEAGIDEEDDLALLCPASWAPPPWPALRTHEIVITPIHTQRELFAEGRSMHNCVASYGMILAAGRAWLYHVEHAEGPSTLLLARAPGERVCVREHMGPFNLPAAAQTEFLVRRWVESLA